VAVLELDPRSRAQRAGLCKLAWSVECPCGAVVEWRGWIVCAQAPEQALRAMSVVAGTTRVGAYPAYGAGFAQPMAYGAGFAQPTAYGAGFAQPMGGFGGFGAQPIGGCGR